MEALQTQKEVYENKLADIAELTAEINFAVQDYITGTASKPVQLQTREKILSLVQKIGSITEYDIETRNLEDVLPPLSPRFLKLG